MHYIPMTDADRAEMLAAIGVLSFEELIADIPTEKVLRDDLNLPPALSEMELIRHIQKLAWKNLSHCCVPSFLGAGSYRHFTPPVVSSLASRPEFLTAYTPYQPEISQGSLQAIFEYQTMMTQLTGLPVSNASLYDGAMATAEAGLLTQRVTRKSKLAVSAGLTPGYRQTLETYIKNQSIDIVELPLSPGGSTDLEALKALPLDELCGVIVQTPNFLGEIEPVQAVADILKDKKTLLVTVVTEALSMGILSPPGENGADIVCGEAQSFGLNTSFGGPYLGFFTAKESVMRQIPGRLVGLTQDNRDNRGFVNTLSTREQHIRREKATSNICTNQALCALTAGIFMATLGRKGLRDTAVHNLKKCAYLKEQIQSIDGFDLPLNGNNFNEFVATVPGSAIALTQWLLEKHIIGGYALGSDYPQLGEAMLFCTTELNSREDLEQLITELKTWSKERQS